MPTRRFPFLSGEYYHLYNRGNNFEKIFLQNDNYDYFLRLLKKYLKPDLIEVIAYCLMPDHYHFLVYLKTDELSKLMQPFLLAYTHAFNVRYNRIGALFQGRFKSRLIDKNEYLLHLSRYIHLNPVKAGLVRMAEEWQFSSYRLYLGLQHGDLVKPEAVLGQFNSPQEYMEFIRQADSVNELEYKDLWME